MRVLDTLPPEFWRGYQRATFPAGSWGCEAGMLRTVAEAEPMDLITRQQYRHFELTLEWRAARGGKSGILSRVTEALPHAWQSGLEMQLLDNAHHPDGQTPETAAGALYGLIAPRRTVLQPHRQLQYGPRRGPCQPRGTVAQWSAGRGVYPAEPRLGSAGGSQQVSGAAWLWPGGPRSHCAPASRCPGVVPSPLSASSPGSADGRSAGPGAGVTRAGTRRRRGQAMRGVVRAASEDAMKTARHG